MNNIRVVQANLQHARGASGVLLHRFAKEDLDLALVQEPWVNNHRVLGLAQSKCKLLYDDGHPSPRAAILVNKRIKFTPITEFINRDIVAIRMEVPTARGKSIVNIVSAYFPGDEEEAPPSLISNFVTRCREQNQHFIIGCDANAHHTVWGSNDINSRGESLLEYISAENIDICNTGNKPTYVNSRRQEVLDLTLCSQILSDKISCWEVSDEESLSDHRHITFFIEGGEISREVFRDPRNTNWERYKQNLATKQPLLDEKIRTAQQLERASQSITNKILQSYYESCPQKERLSNRKVPWWNNTLQAMRRKARKLFNRAKATCDWSQYRRALTEYNKEIRKARRRNWRFTCENIECTPEAARLHKVLSKEHSNGLGNLKKDDGEFTKNPSETLKVLMENHFPGSVVEREDALGNMRTNPGRISNRYNALAKSRNIFTTTMVDWAINSFDPFKSAGEDGLFPALIQHARNIIIPALVEMFISSMTLCYIPVWWKKVRVIFIPKNGKRDRTQAKAYRPISLTSIILKIMEKIVDEHIKSSHLKTCGLNKFQFAYSKGKSTVTALHTLTQKLEKSIEYKEVAFCAFLDIEGAFDNASHASIRLAMNKRGLHGSIVDWVSAMLTHRCIISRLGESTIKVSTSKGCPQGGVLSPMLWSLIVDELLNNLVSMGFEVIGYADDIALVVRGKHDETISNRMQTALNYTLTWCRREGLNVNPSKTTLVIFTRRRQVNIKAPSLDGVELTFSTQVKYLGIILDNKLNWNNHLEHVVNKATSAFWACRRAIGKKWGLRPRIIHWIYLMVIRPKVSYGSLIWWPKTNIKSAQRTLAKLQRLATVSITGAMRSTPTMALDALMHLLPLHQFVQLEARKSAFKLRRFKRIIGGDLTGHLEILKDVTVNPLVIQNEDWMEQKLILDIPYKVTINDRDTWESGGPAIPPGSIVFYTDGSKMGNSTGAGVYGPRIKLALPMGKWPTVFQAEIQAIVECAAICLKRRYRHTSICIFSDSQAALKALSAFECYSKLVWECIALLKELAMKNRVHLLWVPGHCGIAGNENADQLAREGSMGSFYGPEPFCGVSSSALTMELKNWEKQTVGANWHTAAGVSQSKRFIVPNWKTTKTLLKLRKNELSAYVGLLTGHCPSRHFLMKLKRIHSEECRLCGIETETSEHLLCNCSSLFRRRERYLGKCIMQPRDIWLNTNPKNVVTFIMNAIPDWGTMQAE